MSNEHNPFEIELKAPINESRQRGRFHIKDAQLQIDVPTPDRVAGLGDSHTFKNVLGRYLDEVNTLQHDAEAKIQRFVAGEIEDLHEVTTALEEADTAFKLMLELRNRFMDAYNQLRNFT